MECGMVCMWQLMWRCMNTIPIWGHPRGSTWHWLIQGIDQLWGRMVGQEQHQGGALYLHVLGLYLSSGKETLLSLQISAINVTPDAVTFYTPGKQRNCYLNTDFQPPIFDKVFTLCLWLIGPSGLRDCHGTKCPLLMAFFSLSSLSADVTFLPEGVIVGFRNFAWGFHSQTK